MPRLVELANDILKNATALEEYLTSTGKPQPSFDIDAPGRLTIEDPNAAAAHERLQDASRELHLLAIGPMQTMVSLVSFEDALALSTLNRLKIAQHIPLDGQKSIAELAKEVGLPYTDLRPLIRTAMTSHVFSEPTPGIVAPSAASRQLRENAFAEIIVTFRSDEQFPAASRVADAVEKHPNSQEPRLSGWGLANNAERPLFDELSEKYPERMANFNFGVAAVGATAVPKDKVFLGFDWAGLGSAQIVDIGGGKGVASIALAREFRELSGIVQDYEAEIKEGEKELPADVKGRVKFMAHDFRQPQPVKDADVYFFRAVFQIWPDKYCVKILQNLIPCLKKGARVRIHDPMTPDKGLMNEWQDRQKLYCHGQSHVLPFNSHHREVGDWDAIFEAADPRFHIKYKKPSNIAPRAMVNIEVVWDD